METSQRKTINNAGKRALKISKLAKFESYMSDSPCGGIARIQARASRERRHECEALRPPQLRRSRACSLAAHLARHTWRAC